MAARRKRKNRLRAKGLMLTKIILSMFSISSVRAIRRRQRRSLREIGSRATESPTGSSSERLALRRPSFTANRAAYRCQRPTRHSCCGESPQVPKCAAEFRPRNGAADVLGGSVEAVTMSSGRDQVARPELPAQPVVGPYSPVPRTLSKLGKRCAKNAM